MEVYNTIIKNVRALIKSDDFMSSLFISVF